MRRPSSHWISVAGFIITLATIVIGLGRTLQKIDDIQKTIAFHEERMLAIETEMFMALMDSNADQNQMKKAIKEIQGKKWQSVPR